MLVYEREGVVEGGFGVGDFDRGGLDPFSGFGAFGFDAGLFGEQHVLVDQFLVGHLHELLLFGLELLKPALVQVGLLLGFLDSGVDVVPDGLADVFLLLSLVGNRGVVVDDRLLDLGDVEVGGWAATAPGDAGEAGEVLVFAAVAGVQAVAEASVAFRTAEDVVDEVMLVLMRAVAGGLVGGQDLLDALEGGLLDQGFVQPAELLAVMRNDADVEIVAEHPVDAGSRHRLAGPFQGLPGAQPDLLEQVGEGGQRVVPGCEEVEARPDVVLALAVDVDRGDLASLQLLLGVQVANPGGSGSSAFKEAALSTLPHLLAVTPREERVDAREHAVGQHPGRGVGVKRLQDRDQGGAARPHLAQEPMGIELVADHARQVVDDDVGRLELREVREQSLERWPVRVGGGLSRLLVLLQHLSAEGRGPLQHRVTLDRERIPLRVDRLVDL